MGRSHPTPTGEAKSMNPKDMPTPSRDQQKMKDLLCHVLWMLVLLSGVHCDADTEEGPPPPPDPETLTAQWEQEYGLFTAATTGEWAPQIASHVPLSVEVDDTLVISVDHPMDADHGITAIYVKDQQGHVVDLRELDPGPSSQALTNNH